jgi:ammonia channel protein AmtB
MTYIPNPMSNKRLTCCSYCPVACWTWNANGWLYNLPSLDYAGSGPVHIASGCSALAYAVVLGKRKHHGHSTMTKPHNVSMVFIGTLLMFESDSLVTKKNTTYWESTLYL